MLIFLISCFSLLLLFQSLLNPNPISKFESLRGKLPCFYSTLRSFLMSRRIAAVKTENEKLQGISLLDLPDLPLDCILEKLTPSELYSMAGVCSSLRERCINDFFWEKHLKLKWGKFIGDAAHREWQCYISSKRVPKNCIKQRRFHTLPWLFMNNSDVRKRSCGGLVRYPLPVNSVMAWYYAFETGKFWFPAQVLNRESGHLGFMLSCYDAKLSYDSIADNFVARFSSQGRRIIEDGIEWSKIRAADCTTTPEALHVSDCLDDLKPGDHIEIQWRKNKEFPYGWWYGVVAHMESCNGNQFNCQCHMADTVTLEFNQYATESCWRKVVINRKDHSEIGNEMDGFYGGIRKLYKDEDIAKWKQLWPECTLDS